MANLPQSPALRVYKQGGQRFEFVEASGLEPLQNITGGTMASIRIEPALMKRKIYSYAHITAGAYWLKAHIELVLNNVLIATLPFSYNYQTGAGITTPGGIIGYSGRLASTNTNLVMDAVEIQDVDGIQLCLYPFHCSIEADTIRFICDGVKAGAVVRAWYLGCYGEN